MRYNQFSTCMYGSYDGSQMPHPPLQHTNFGDPYLPHMYSNTYFPPMFTPPMIAPGIPCYTCMYNQSCPLHPMHPGPHNIVTTTIMEGIGPAPHYVEALPDYIPQSLYESPFMEEEVIYETPMTYFVHTENNFPNIVPKTKEDSSRKEKKIIRERIVQENEPNKPKKTVRFNLPNKQTKIVQENKPDVPPRIVRENIPNKQTQENKSWKSWIPGYNLLFG